MTLKHLNTYVKHSTYTVEPLLTATLGEMDYDRLYGVGRLSEVETINEPTLGL